MPELRFTDCKDKHRAGPCPKCDVSLRVAEDHYGGGSHYWTLVCDRCDTRYIWDTYRFELEEWPWKK